MLIRLRQSLRSIRSKFIAIQLVSILLTLALMTGFSLLLLRDYHRNSQREKLEAHAVSRAIEADQIISQLFAALTAIKTYDYPRSPRPQPLIAEFAQYARTFPKSVYLNRRGEEQVKVVRGQPRQDLTRAADEALLSKVLGRPNEVVVSLRSSDVDFSQPVLVLTQARGGSSGDEVQGIVQAVIPLSEFAARFSKRYLDEQVSLVMLDKDGRILLHPQQERLFLPLLGSRQELRQLVGGMHPGEVLFSRGTLAGVDSYFAAATLSKLNWLSFAVVPQTEFNRLLENLARYSLMLAAIGLLFGTLLAHMLGRPVLGNIRKIKQQTQNLAAGKLDQRVLVNSGDELEDLALAVNQLTEKLVSTSEARASLDLMLRGVVDPLVITDNSGTIIKVNPASLELFGVAEATLVGSSLSRFFSRQSPYAALDSLVQLLGSDEVTNLEGAVQAADGEVPVIFSFAHAEGGGASETGLVVWSFKNIAEQKIAEQKIARLAYYDSLTGLPNRSLLQDRLAETICRAEEDETGRHHFAVMFLDLDHFKVVNDSLGHSVGDQLLQSAAERLKDCLRRADTISRVAPETSRREQEEHVLARLGGDEFIILLPRLRSSSDAALVARRIIADMARPFQLGPHEVVTPASIGLAIYPEDGSDSDTLLRCADVAMYHAKEQGRNSFFFFSEEMNEIARERLELEHRLRSDIERGQGFHLLYQPKVDLQTGRVCGMEVLTRWENAELGPVSPVRFIPIAEDSGLIVPLGRWIIQTACEQIKAWQEQRGMRLKVAINLSGRQLKQPDLLPMIAEILDETGLDPSLLELELTESMLMETVEKTILLLYSLQDLGVTLAIDDFGTGYSSLSYLKRFPIDTLKIDRSFVRDLEADRDDAAIVQAIIAMSRTLGLQVVAEGVETEGQLDFLKENGAHQYQGFLFSKPVCAREFEERFL